MITIKALCKQRFPSDFFFSLLSKLVRLLFFWAYLETESLSEKRRDYIKELPDCNVETNDNVTLSLSSLLYAYKDEILKYCIKDSINKTDSFFELDYQPEMDYVKTLVGSRENKIKFALWFYSIWGKYYGPFPLDQYLAIPDKAEKKDLYFYKSLCVAAISEFDSTDKCLNNKAKERVQELRCFYNNQSSIDHENIRQSFDIINHLIIQVENRLNNILTDENPQQKTTTIQEKLKDAMENNEPIIIIDDSISLDNATDSLISPYICDRRYTEENRIADDLKQNMIKIANGIIRKKLPVVKLSFDKNGVQTLTNMLRSVKYTFRNYTFYDDWALAGIRETQEYSELRSLVDKIPNESHSPWTNVFLNLDKIRLNYSIEISPPKKLTGEILEWYLSSFRIADEQYKIDDIFYYNKNDAIKHLQDTKYTLDIRLKVETNVQSTSGFRIEYKKNI